MRLTRVLVLTLAALWSHPGHADTRDDVTALIHAGDMAAILRALANPDPAMQRQSFAAFVTSRADVAALSKAMLEAHPGDPRAMIARGWHLQALGWAMRGEGSVRETWPEALVRMDAMHAEAFDLAEQALAIDPGLFPASDLLLSLARTTHHRKWIPGELDRAMALWPNRQSLILAVQGMTPNWGGPPGWGPDACARYAPVIADTPGYTPAICEIDIVFAAGYSVEDRDHAYQRLANYDHPILDDARYSYATSVMVPRTYDAIVMLKGFRDRGLLGLRGAQRLDELQGTPFDQIGPATRKVIATDMPKLRAAVDFDPADNRALSKYIEALNLEVRITGVPVGAEEITARYGALFALSPYDGRIWSDYGHLMSGTLSPDTATLDQIEGVRGYFENGVVYSLHSATSLFFLDGFNQWVWQHFDRRNLDAIDATGQAAFPKPDYDAAVVCPTIRTLRVIEAVCEADPDQWGCNPDDSRDRARADLVARAEKRAACTAEREGPVEGLAYQSVAVELSEEK